MLELSGVKRISLDTETTGLDRHGADRPVGLSVASEKGDAYYAWGHPSGNSHSLEQVRQWAAHELPGKEVSLVNPSLDLGMLKKEGIDLERLGAIPRGVQYKCALIDERRRKYDLGAMSLDYLKRSKKEEPWHAKDAHKQPGNEVAGYAKQDARLTLDLDNHFDKLLDKQDLQRVAKLEDDLIYCVLHMEDQGTFLDVPKLRRWDVEIEAEVARREKALRGLNPRSEKEMTAAFQKLGFYDFSSTETGKNCFDKNAVKAYRAIGSGNKRLVALCNDVLALRAVSGLRTRSTEAFLEALRDGGILRYHLHQCRADDNGTVSGRFSASGINIQQVSAEEKQDPATLDWIIRELFLPRRGTRWLSGDASQIEFRLFAHYSNSEALIRAYLDDPNCDFHAVVATMVNLIRKLAKNVNFGMVYGMGQKKIANDLGLSPDKADAFFNDYHARFPEAKVLMERCMRVARERGYVRTLLGRRRRFPGGRQLHAALNAVLQGSAADLMKLKLIKLYREMKNLEFNLRFTVHDEVDGDLMNPERESDIRALLNEQEIPLKVPIVWNVKTGDNWRQAA
jgi:DNA polymerase I